MQCFGGLCGNFLDQCLDQGSWLSETAVFGSKLYRQFCGENCLPIHFLCCFGKFGITEAEFHQKIVFAVEKNRKSQIVFGLA